jgi:hypothetical protein
MPTLVLLGAEGLAELEGVDWLRAATPAETATFKRRHRLSELDYEAASLDGTGRPYFLVALLPGAPDVVCVRARAHLRVLRLVD